MTEAGRDAADQQVEDIRISALEVRVRVVAERRLAAALRSAWAPCLVRTGDVDAVVRTAEVCARTAPATTEDALRDVTEAVNAAAIEARAGELLLLHASAVADPRSGAAVVLVGRSGAGKTTLAVELARRWSYVADETVAVRPDGSLVVYPRPLSLRLDGHGPKRPVPPTDLGLTPARGRPRAVRIALLDRGPDPTAVDVAAVPTLPAIAQLAEQTSYLAALDRPLARLAALLHDTGGLHRVRFARPEQLVPVVRDWLGGQR